MTLQEYCRLDRGCALIMEPFGEDSAKIRLEDFLPNCDIYGRVADEIVDAWDSYQADRDRAKEAVGLPELNRRGKEINERRRRLWSQIAATPARTVEGMHAKIAFASSFNLLERGDLVEGTMDDILLSAAMDYADIHGQEART